MSGAHGDQRTLRLLASYRSDLNLYAKDCITIRDKQGLVERFPGFNAAQLYIHAQLEAQLERTGKVRALILKGRQQGACHSPETKVLTSTYEWRQIGDLSPGDRLLAFDEEYASRTASGRSNSRRFRTTVVEVVVWFNRKRIRLTLDNGAILTTTAEHRYLSKQRGGDVVLWRTVSDCKRGDRLRVVTKPPQHITAETAWLAGIFDGEGSLRRTGSSRLSFNQQPGKVLERGRRALDALGVRVGEVVDNRGSGSFGERSVPVHRLDVHRQSDVLHVLSHCPTSRFREEGLFDGHELPGKRADGGTAWARVVDIEELNKGEVVDLQTAHKTYVAEGVASHNSTYTAARYYRRATLHRGTNVYILSHEQASADALFKMVERFQINNPIAPHVGISNVKEMVFDKLDSSYAVATAGAKAGGRSRTLSLFHGSECAYWENAAEHFSASVQAVPDMPGTEIILESTASGASGEFYERWQDAIASRGDYIPIFVPWYWQEEYTRPAPDDFELETEPGDTGITEKEYARLFDLPNERMAWRRAKVAELRSVQRFDQEYPGSPDMAFQSADTKKSFILPIQILRARKRKIETSAGPLIVGVDPSGPGKDRFSVAWRRGLKVEKIEYRQMPETAEAVQWLRAIIDDDLPDRMFVDLGNIGHSIVSLLKAIDVAAPDGRRYSEIVRGINFGATSQSKMARPKMPGPKNRRAEMWDRSREWLDLEEGVSLPDMDMLQADATAPRIKPLLNNDFLIESKDQMRSRNVRSPDLWDSVALTFAELERIVSTKDGESRKRKADQKVSKLPVTASWTPPPPMPGGADSWMGL